MFPVLFFVATSSNLPQLLTSDQRKVTDLVDSTRECRLMSADLFENCCGAPHEHAAVPVIITSFEILGRFGGIWLFHKSVYRMPLQRSLLRQQGLPIRLN